MSFNIPYLRRTRELFQPALSSAGAELQPNIKYITSALDASRCSPGTYILPFYPSYNSFLKKIQAAAWAAGRIPGLPVYKQ